MLAPLHSAIDRGEHEKYLFLPLYIWKYGKSICDSACPQDRLITVNRQKGDYASFSVLSNILATECFKQKDNVLNFSAITAVTKSSIKARSGTTANCHLCEERYGEQR